MTAAALYFWVHLPQDRTPVRCDRAIHEGSVTVATETSGLAERYAVALYDLADADKALDAVADDLKRIAALIDESSELRSVLDSQYLKRDLQGRAILAVIDRLGVSALTRSFIGVVADNRRLAALKGIIRAFLERLAKKRGEVAAEIISAQPLTAEQTDRLTNSLKSVLGSKVNVDLKVDNGLIGGLVVRVGSRLIDHSIKTKLARLQLAMKGVG